MIDHFPVNRRPAGAVFRNASQRTGVRMAAAVPVTIDHHIVIRSVLPVRVVEKLPIRKAESRLAVRPYNGAGGDGFAWLLSRARFQTRWPVGGRNRGNPHRFRRPVPVPMTKASPTAAVCRPIPAVARLAGSPSTVIVVSPAPTAVLSLVAMAPRPARR